MTVHIARSLGIHVLLPMMLPDPSAPANSRWNNSYAAPLRGCCRAFRSGDAPDMKSFSQMKVLGRRVRAGCRMAVLLLPMLMLFTGAQAQDFTYTTNNGTIAITGYTGPGGNVTIPSVITGLPVTVIGDRAFSSLASLTGITIPSSVTNIGDAAFGQCNLTNVIIPDSVTYLGDAAFFACTSLASLTI